MPLLNKFGDVIAGGGGERGSLNGVYYPFVSSGSGCFKTDDTILVQRAPEYVLVEWEFLGSNGPTTVQPARGANSVAGASGRWLANLTGFMYGSPGDTPDAALIGVAPDGTMAWYPNAQSGIGLIIVDPNGLVHEYPNVIAYPAATVVKAGQVIWEGGAVGRLPIKPVLKAQNPKLVNVSGEDWIVYWSEGTGLIAQVDGESEGWLLDSRALEFNHNVANVNGELWLTWSITAGERPEDVVVCKITRDEVTYLRKAFAWAPQLAQWKVLTPSVIIPKFNFSHKVLVRPFFADGSGVPDVFTLGTYTEATALPNPMPEGRLLLGHDGPQDWTIPNGLRPWDIPLIELYLLKTESITQTVARLRRQVSALRAQWPGDCGVIPMFYCQGGVPPNELWTVGEVCDLLQSLSDFVNTDPRIKLIAPFAYKRANGITAHVELKQAFNNLMLEADRVGEASLIPLPVDPPPIDPPKPVTPYPAARPYTRTI